LLLRIEKSLQKPILPLRGNRFHKNCKHDVSTKKYFVQSQLMKEGAKMNIQIYIEKIM
jgi:hypothetical protein